MVALLCAGCGSDPATPPPSSTVDAGVVTDRPVAPRDTDDGRGDRDRDGLCDGTERALQTDLDRADSDGDGVIDIVELYNGSDPNNPRDPAPRDRVTLVESVDRVAAIDEFVDVFGAGEVYALAWLDRAPGLDGRFAGDVVQATVEAVSADPLGFVRDIEADRFEGVSGRVRLQWRVTLRPRVILDPDAGVPTPGCRRSYGVVLSTRQEGGAAVQTRDVTVDLTPAPSDGGVAPWPSVNDDGLCLPVGPCR